MTVDNAIQNIWMGVLFAAIVLFLFPVSYTHLDVYKRQKEPSFEDSFLCNFGLLSGEITPQP